MTPPLAVLQFVERMDATLLDWGERPNHWLVRFTDGRMFQVSKEDPNAEPKQIKGDSASHAKRQRKLAEK